MENLTAQQVLEAMEAKEARAKKNYFTTQSLLKSAIENGDKASIKLWKKENKEAWDNYFAVSQFVFGVKRNLGLVKGE